MIKKLLNETDVSRLKRFLADSEKIVLTCHVRPDGDAIGSTLGLYHLLKSMGKDVHVITPDLPPRSISFLPGFNDIVAYTKYPEFARRTLKEAQLVICCDFNKLSRLDSLSPAIGETVCPKVLLDHHLDPDYFADITFSFPDMSSACEVVFRVIAALGYMDDMNLDAATCLATGIITDTRNLSVNNSKNPELYLIMYELIRRGVDKVKIVREALEVKSEDCFRLQAFTMSEKLRLLPKFHGALITLSREELDRFNYERGDSEGFVNAPLTIKGVVFCFFLREDPDCIKVSARSVDGFPVNKVCEDLFGGGGHLQASGGEFKGTMEECVDLLISHLPDYEKYLPKKQIINNAN